VHGWDVYHYYLGAKYFHELGYTRLYECGVIADAEDGLLESASRPDVRDLATHRIVPGWTILAHPERCTSEFSPARWALFKRDHGWFRERIAPDRWARMRRDHGYNATPVWSAAGHLLAGSGPASWTQIVGLALLDPILLAVMWGAVGWAFGWRAMCVALIYWGTNFPARFAWIGGSFLRQDWLALSIVGLCLLRRGYPAIAGLSLGWATCSRVFPASMLGGILARATIGRWNSGSPGPPSCRRVLLGATLSIAVLVPLASTIVGGWPVWVSFWNNSVRHVTSPISNRMGLAALAAYDHQLRAPLVDLRGSADDGDSGWENGRRVIFHNRRHLFVPALLAFAVTVLWAASRQPDWVAAILGVGLVAATELTCYYYSVLLAYGLVGDRRQGIGAALCALSAVGGVMGMLKLWDDALYALLSVASLVFVLVTTIALGRRPFVELDRARSR
jgi:hypothetical protein